ncbi:hypothetical protein OIU34_27890 [Pararhizobium sp. BT-229]|uniref:trypsin-like serine peptidase n=1 Tax=Pararhizobium sp. BT-229 TaxID=2986923 RepID=UPI0021F7E0AB|nr:hypothetical protein [Pararhizobium sp. BT-229]MCV9965699.1 hypothetical protein [Pararhizobium sp. BT-229]
MEQKDIEILTNVAIPEAIRIALANSILGSQATQSERDFKYEQLRLERKKFIWNTPLVAAVAGLITLSATFFFDRITNRDTTNNTITLEQVRQELKDSEARLRQQLEAETTKTVAEIESLAKEREFQYEIVKSELTNREKTNAERAAVLLFLVKAGVLSTLDRNELQTMAEDQLQNPHKDIIPQLTPNSDFMPAIVGADDARPITAFNESAPVRMLARSVGLLTWKSGGEAFNCTAFLVARDQIATAGYCMKDNVEGAIFSLLPMGKFSNPIHLKVDLSRRQEFQVGEDGSYIHIGLQEPADESFKPLVIGKNLLKENSPLGVIYFRNGVLFSAVWGASDCRVVKLEPSVFEHLCDTGVGTSGSPIFDIATNSVVGMHIRRSQLGGMAYRLDVPYRQPTDNKSSQGSASTSLPGK